MMRSNQTSSTNRQDDLLKRLKQCVGQVNTKSHNKQYIKSNQQYTRPYKQSQKSSNKQISSRQPLLQRSSNKLDQRYSFTNKQIKTDKKYHVRQQDYRQSFNSKQNINKKDILNLTKNYLQSTQINKSYRSDRKHSIPLYNNTDITNIKKQLFTKQNQGTKIFSNTKDVSDSTKKRIAQRQSLINCQIQKITPKKPVQRGIEIPSNKVKISDQDQFLQRLSLRKINYLQKGQDFKNDSTNIKKRQNSIDLDKFNKEQIRQNIQTKYSRQIKRNSIQLDRASIQLKRNQIQAASTRITSQKYENYTKKAIQNMMKDNDYRKAQKMQKLKKITDMNEQINNRIKRIVDTFQNYLTYRQA